MAGSAAAAAAAAVDGGSGGTLALLPSWLYGPLELVEHSSPSWCHQPSADASTTATSLLCMMWKAVSDAAITVSSGL